MPYENLILLAPCHGIDDFPLYHTGDDAASLLACWTSLWHPSLLQAAKKLPRVERCDYPPENLSNSLFVLPKPCEAEMAEDLPAEIEAAGSVLVRGETVTRRDVLRQCLQHYPPELHVSKDAVRDFLAFGFTLLQVELLTQQMRYSSSIDQSRIERTVFEAASAALKGLETEYQDKLIACHDALADERSHYYPVDVYLMDLTLLAQASFGPALVDIFAQPNRGSLVAVPENLLASGEVIEQLSGKLPDVCDLLRQRAEAGTMGFGGGEYCEHPLPLLGIESIMRQLQRGAVAWKGAIGRTPSVYARRRNGIFPSLSYGVRNAGYDSALHLKFDEGTYPEATQSKTSWACGNSVVMPCLSRPPLDANAHHTFLDLPRELSDSMDTDFVAARAFWHWPGHVTPWYQDLRRSCQFGSALGKFVTLDQFFDESSEPNSEDSFLPASYSYPFLTQSAAGEQPDPHSRWTRYWMHTIRALVLRGTLAMSRAIKGRENEEGNCKLSELQQLEQQIDLLPEDSTLSDELSTLQNCVSETLGQSLTQACSDAAKTVINPLPFARRIYVKGNLSPHVQGTAVYATSGQGASQQTLLDVPGMGFATVSAGQQTRVLEGPELAEGMTLRNEFLSVAIDEVTGSLRALRDYGLRTTRLSQQLGLRITVPKTGQHWVDRQAPVGYSIMAADRAEITENGQLRAEITTEGRMLAPNGETVGEFQQRFQITRGSRVLNIEIEIQPQFELLLENEPWDSYYASRFAFGDESAILTAGRHYQCQELSSRRIEAPLFVEIDTPQHRTAVLSGGLPYHRRVSDTQLDTLLITGGLNAGGEAWGESNQRFRIGIGVDLPNPVHAAVDWMAAATPPIVLNGKTQSETGWLFHVTAKNVLASAWDPVESGMRIRLVETQGRRTRFKLAAFKPWRRVQRERHSHGPRNDVPPTESDDLPINEGVAELSLEPFEVIDLLGHY